MRPLPLCTLLLTACMTVAAQVTPAQLPTAVPEAASVDSLRCGHRQLGRALLAHGGEARFIALQQLAFRAEGHCAMAIRVSRPSAGATRRPLENCARRCMWTLPVAIASS
jgi:hypothetical protein